MQLVVKKRRYEIEGKILKERMYNVISKHVGSSKAVSRDKLFYRVFGVRWKDLNEYQMIVLAVYFSNAVRSVRMTTKAFIVSQRTDNGSEYFVLSNTQELGEFENQINSRRQTLTSQLNRAKRSVSEGWHNQIK